MVRKGWSPWRILTLAARLAVVNLPLICALTGVEVIADPIPISSEVAISATAGIDLLGGAVLVQPTDSQTTTLNPLSASVDNAVVYPAGAPLLVGSNCNPSAANYCVSVDGQKSATWTSAAQGSVTFSNYGWYDHLPTSGVGQATGGSSTLGPATVPQFDYQFVADASGVMDIHYALTATGTDLFGLEGFLVTVSGGSGGSGGAQTAGPVICGNPGPSFCTPGMTWSGDILATIDAGATYNFFFEDQSNVSAGLGDRTALWNATFAFTIPSSTPATVPEPSSLVLFASGLVILAHLSRARRTLRSGRRS
jgi:hypothetical protein